MLGVILLISYLFIGTTLAIALNVKLDWTENKELLLWYDEYDGFTGGKERKFVKILKF